MPVYLPSKALFHSMSIGLIRDTSVWHNRLIMRVTKGEYAHAFVVYHNQHDSSQDIFVESQKRSSSLNASRGLSFPIPLSALRLYIAAHKHSIQSVLIQIPASPIAVADSYSYYLSKINAVRYAPLQLLSNYISARTKLLFSTSLTAKNRWTCSEAAIRLMPPSVQHSYFKVGVFRYDEYVPSGTVPASIARLATNAHLPFFPF